MKSIETRAGLLAAIWDVICDEMPEYFPVAAILERLPYGQRVRDIMVQLTREGGYRKYAARLVSTSECVNDNISSCGVTGHMNGRIDPITS